MSYHDALNIIKLYQESHQLDTWQQALFNMLRCDVTELFAIEQTAIKVVIKYHPELMGEPV
jgi:hypothetical protein